MDKVFKIIMGVMIVALIGSCTVVGASDRAVRVTLGKIEGGVVQPGMYWFFPLVSGYPSFSLLPKEVDYAMAVGKDGGITKDNQTIGATMKGFYRYKADQIVAVYRDFSEDRISSLFETAMRQSVKAVIGQYTIFEIAANQDVIRGKIIAELRDSISDLPIEVTDIRVINYDWTDEFDKQIANTMETAQKAKNAEQELIVVTTNAKKGVAQAEADKQQAVIKAEGDLAAAKLQADAKAAEGEGIRRYNAAIAQNLEIQLKLRALDIESARVDKWDGHYVSTNNYGPIPFQTGSIQGK